MNILRRRLINWVLVEAVGAEVYAFTTLNDY